MARLNGWQRIGIIVSVVWILGAGIYAYRWMGDNYVREACLQIDKCKDAALEGARKKYDAQGNIIVPQAVLPPDFVADCDEQGLAYLASTKRYQLYGAAFAAFAPLPLGWGFVYLIFFLVNWVKRGFISPGNSN